MILPVLPPFLQMLSDAFARDEGGQGLWAHDDAWSEEGTQRWQGHFTSEGFAGQCFIRVLRKASLPLHRLEQADFDSSDYLNRQNHGFADPCGAWCLFLESVWGNTVRGQAIVGSPSGVRRQLLAYAQAQAAAALQEATKAVGGLQWLAPLGIAPAEALLATLQTHPEWAQVLDYHGATHSAEALGQTMEGTEAWAKSLLSLPRKPRL